MAGWRRGKSHKWKRVLHFGMEGQDVERLQKILLSLGYNPGEPDGVYGWQTEDSVRQFQKDHGLRIDGLAGPCVFELIEDPLLPESTVIHVAERGDTLRSVAQKYGVGPSAISTSGGISEKRALKPDQRLVIHLRRVIGMSAPGEPSEVLRRTLLQRRRDLSAILPMWFRLQADGSVAGEPDADLIRLAQSYGIALVPVFHNLAGPGRFCGERPSSWLRDRKWVKSAITAILEAADNPNYGGVHLELRGLKQGDGLYFFRMIHQLSTGLSARKCPLSIGLKFRADNSVAVLGPWLDHGYRGLSSDVDTIVIRLDRLWDNPNRPVQPSHHANKIPLSLLKVWLSRLLEEVPPWKVVLSLPVYSLDFTLAERVSPVPLSYEKACAIVRKPEITASPRSSRRSRLKPVTGLESQSGFPHVLGRKEHLLFVEEAASLAPIIDLINRYNLRGLAVWPVGWEDRSLWHLIRDKFGLLKTGYRTIAGDEPEK